MAKKAPTISDLRYLLSLNNYFHETSLVSASFDIYYYSSFGTFYFLKHQLLPVGSGMNIDATKTNAATIAVSKNDNQYRFMFSEIAKRISAATIIPDETNS